MRAVAAWLVLPLVCVSVPAAAQEATARRWQEAPQRWSAEPVPSDKPWRQQMDRAPMSEGVVIERIWYGWQTVLVDVLSIGAMVASGVLETEELAWTGLGLMLVGAPVVHLGHKNYGSAAISFGMRVGSGLVTLGGVVLAVNEAFDDDEGLGVAITVLGIAGAVASVVVDASVLGFDDLEAPPKRMTQVVPWIDPERGHIGLHFAMRL